MSVKIAKDGASHLNLRAIQRVSVARSREKIGSISNEWVMLRCQVITSRRSCEKISRKTSISGKIAPSISDQVMMRARFIGFAGNISSPLQNALPIKAPAMPCVMVSIFGGSVRLGILPIREDDHAT